MQNPFINPKAWNTAERVALSASIDSLILTSASLDSVAAGLTATNSTLATVSGSGAATLTELTAISGVVSGNVASISALSTSFSSSEIRDLAVSSSLSGVLGSSSLYTPTAIYIKSPGGSIYQFTIDNSGVLSSTLV